MVISYIIMSIDSNANDHNAKLRTAKVSHAEPLYFDLVRDLGARKGEKEWNVGADFINLKDYNAYPLLVEYEFAPVNRLGLEVESDFLFYKGANDNDDVPGNKMECLRLSAQYSFFVSSKYKTTLAIGYTQLIELTDFRSYGKKQPVTGIGYNPFFIAAKRWGNNFHTLSYTSPVIEQDPGQNRTVVNWQINTSFHYTLPHTGHFIGIELNKKISNGKFEMVLRPQMKVRLSQNLAVGLVAGLPLNKRNEGFSSFFRIIYEP